MPMIAITLPTGRGVPHIWESRSAAQLTAAPHRSEQGIVLRCDELRQSRRAR